MEDFDPRDYGRLHAEDYDAAFGSAPPDEAVETIAGIVGGGSLLELGIGTGRLALPLARRGVRVSGVDASPEMVAELRAKPGGDAIPVTIGDMADLPVEGPFDCALIAFNTLFCPATQDAQARLFADVAARLTGGGAFVVEAFVPDPTRFTGGQALRTERIERGGVALEAARHDPVRQRIEVQMIRIKEDGVRLAPLVIRYAWPSEIDLMARMAGLSLEARWGGWDRSRFAAGSRSHVSVYRRGG